MRKKHARLTVLMDADRKKELDQLCASLGTNSSELVRELIARYLRSHSAEPGAPAKAAARRRTPKSEEND